MKVSSLQQFVRSLIAPIRAAGAAVKVTGDLEQTASDLEPFAQLDVWQLAELLRQAREYRDTGILPVAAAVIRLSRMIRRVFGFNLEMARLPDTAAPTIEAVYVLVKLLNKVVLLEGGGGVKVEKSKAA